MGVFELSRDLYEKVIGECPIGVYSSTTTKYKRYVLN